MSGGMTGGGTGGRLVAVEKAVSDQKDEIHDFKKELREDFKDLRETVYATGYRLAFAVVVAAIGMVAGVAKFG